MALFYVDRWMSEMRTVKGGFTVINWDNQQFNDDATDIQGGGAEPQTFEVNGQKMTAEQVIESYKKLQSEHTRVTQKNSELSKDSERVKEWVGFDQYLDQMEQTTPGVKQQVGKMIDSFLQSTSKGDTPTQGQMGQLTKAIDKAEQKGDDETAKRLKELETIVMETTLGKEYDAIEKTAQKDGIDFDLDEFKEFTNEWLDELGIGDDDEFDIKLVRKAYDAYEAKKLKEDKKKDIPPLGTSGGTSSPDKPKENKVGGLKGAFERATKRLSN